jgi:hypothetical protein
VGRLPATNLRPLAAQPWWTKTNAIAIIAQMQLLQFFYSFFAPRCWAEMTHISSLFRVS